MSAVFRMQDVEGFSPIMDATRTEKLFVLGGKNYVMDARGARSAFGNRLLSPFSVGNPAHVQGFRIDTRQGSLTFTITTQSILIWDEQAGDFRLIYQTPDTSAQPYRWSYGYLSGKVYLCHPMTGILVYDVDSKRCFPHDGPGVPTNAICVTEDSGVLVAITPTHYHWSTPSDGMDFAPALGGAGFQLIQARVSGAPIMVTSYAQGCLTWTTGGIMRSEFTGDQAVYRHRAIQSEYRPINSFCTVRIDDSTTVILDRRGLFQTRGATPESMSPVFNEFLTKYLLENKLHLGQNVRLEWDNLRRRIYVSVSLSYGNPIYEHAFVLYPNLNRWGQFSEPHHGILPVTIENRSREDDYFGFVDADGCVRYWDESSSREKRPSETDHTQHEMARPRIQKPTMVRGGVTRVTSSALLSCRQQGTTVNSRAGYYDDARGIPVAPSLTGLDADVSIGLFRPNPGDSVDRSAEVISMLVRSGLGGPTVPASLGLGTSNDWTVGENIGLDRSYYVDHKLVLASTKDGVSVFDSVEPSLVQEEQAARYYACTIVGLWFIVQFKAESVGQYFYPVTLEMTAIDAGRDL